jgi:endoribonuclease Dicer
MFFTRHFQQKKWFPNGDCLPSEENDVHIVSRKSVADFVEALIGACYVDGGTDVALDFLSDKLKLVSPRILPAKEDRHKTDSISLDLTDSLDSLADDGGMSENGFGISRLETLLGYKFVDPRIPIKAFTHSSHESNVDSYQRLEFLGDSVLDWLVTRCTYLFTLT